ncbi:alpha/beta hydrolase [Ruegeria sediminis]|uniref:Alpha/beta hydrolase n=2 Tax=Ruegeria sediminis TaxID=2583820 RepID=A0ABY2WWC3_9RHOB|nr:alpha/beta hydrolase [Ruegeria sediminis]
MATFGLVHGAWQGGWCWKRVASLLRQAGHDVFTPTMTGLGERAHLFDTGIDLDTHIQDILGVIQYEELSDVVLCGHSYGGMVITGVADKASERIRSLIYLDALVPADGQSVLDVLPAEIASDLHDTAKDGRVPPGPAAAFSVNDRDQTWVDRRNVDQPFKTFQQPIHLEGKWRMVPKRTYIYATGWNPGLGRTFFEKARNEAEWEASSIACGHYVMIDMPEELTGLLTAAI